MLFHHYLPSTQVSHLVPLQSFGQVQETSPLVVSRQVPPFRQGSGAQGSELLPASNNVTFDNSFVESRI